MDFISAYEIVQPTKKSIKPEEIGKYRSKGWCGPEITCSVLCVSQSRSLWGAYDENATDDKPLCFSKDGIKPGSGTAMLSGPCSTCPKSQWGKGQNGKSIKPACSEIINFFCWDFTRQVQFFVQFKRTGVGPANEFLTNMRNLASRKYADMKDEQGRPIPEACFIKVKMSLAQVKNYYVPKFELLAPSDIPEAKENRATMKGLMRLGAHIRPSVFNAVFEKEMAEECKVAEPTKPTEPAKSTEAPKVTEPTKPAEAPKQAEMFQEKPGEAKVVHDAPMTVPVKKKEKKSKPEDIKVAANEIGMKS